jgi:hypothetical protein
MTCIFDKGSDDGCKNKVGGIAAAYFINTPFVVTEVNNIVTNITSDGLAVRMFKYSSSETSTYQETVSSLETTGSKFWTQQLNLVIKYISENMREQIDIMAAGRFGVIIFTNNRKTLFVGMNRLASAESGLMETGQTLGDFQGYRMEIKGQEKTPANFIIDGSNTFNPSYPFENLTNPPLIIKGSDLEETSDFIVRVYNDSGIVEPQGKQCLNIEVIRLQSIL